MIIDESRVLLQDLGYLKGSDIPEGSHTFWTGTDLAQSDFKKEGLEDSVHIQLLDGSTIPVAANHKIWASGRYEKPKWTRARDLTKKHFVYLTKSSFDFDFNELDMRSEDLGVLSGIIYSYRESGKVKIPFFKEELRAEIRRLLKIKEDPDADAKLNVPYPLSLFPMETLETCLVGNTLPETMWRSKPMVRGFIRVLLSNATFRKGVFELNGNKALVDIQQFLNLWEIRSTYIGRIFNDPILRLQRDDCYKISKYISTFDALELFKGLDYRNVLKYPKRMYYSLKRFKIYDIDDIGKRQAYSVGECIVNGAITCG